MGRQPNWKVQFAYLYSPWCWQHRLQSPPDEVNLHRDPSNALRYPLYACNLNRPDTLQGILWSRTFLCYVLMRGPEILEIMAGARYLDCDVLLGDLWNCVVRVYLSCNLLCFPVIHVSLMVCNFLFGWCVSLFGFCPVIHVSCIPVCHTCKVTTKNIFVAFSDVAWWCGDGV